MAELFCAMFMMEVGLFWAVGGEVSWVWKMPSQAEPKLR